MYNYLMSNIVYSVLFHHALTISKRAKQFKNENIQASLNMTVCSFRVTYAFYRVNLHSTVASMLRNYLLEKGAIYEV